jgi:PAS domain S-box-containing protein
MHEDRHAMARRLLDLAVKQIGNHALVLLDPEGKIVDWKAGAEHVFGFRADEIIGRPVTVLFTPEDIAQGIPVWERATAANSGEAEDDRWQVRRDGGRIWVSGALSALRDEHGELAGFAKVMRDRTDQKTKVESLETRIESLEDADQRRINFTSTLAHELRSPLSAVATAASLIEQRAGRSPELAFAVGSIRRQVDFMSRLITDLLEVVRATLGKVQLHRERLLLQNVIADACEACAPSVMQRKHKLQRLQSEAPIYLEGDPVRLRQVFINLIENACKYTPPQGEIWIKVTTETEEAVVKVSDTGIGIAPELMPHIFELFTQADDVSKAGLGIGLALVKETVSLHGGTVQATSPGVNKGAEFTVRLPLPSQRAPSSP